MEYKFHIDKQCSTPYHTQIAEQIHLLIHTGQLRPGERMPTVRSLAVNLGVNANTVARVYRDLQDRGFLELQRGAGTFIARTPPERPIVLSQFKSIERRTQRLITLCREAGFSLKEFHHLVETLWKETPPHES